MSPTVRAAWRTGRSRTERGIASRWILAVLRNRTFYSLEEMRVAVAELLEKLSPARLAAGVAAVDLPSVAAPADVEHRRAVSAAGLAEAVVEAVRGA